MLVTNIRIEAPSNRPSLLQVMVNASTAAMDGMHLAWGLWAPYQTVLFLNAVNRAATRALFRM